MSMPSREANNIVLDELHGKIVAEVWPLVEPLLQKGIDRVATSRTTAEIRKNVDEGRWRLWAILRRKQPLPILAAAATYTHQTNRGLVAVIDTIGGVDMADWFEPALARFEELARLHGVTRIEVEGRMGWARRLPGFTAKRIVLEKVIEHV
jgi:hypothetical protein